MSHLFFARIGKRQSPVTEMWARAAANFPIGLLSGGSFIMRSLAHPRTKSRYETRKHSATNPSHNGPSSDELDE